jgi:hypothetical protein
VSDAYTTYLAQGSESAPITELCTIDGGTYISGPETLPTQPEQIEITETVLDATLREQIKAASPHCQLISQRMQEQIRARYSAEDEVFLTRIACGQALGVYQMSDGEQTELADYQVFVEGVREWGRTERAGLGL